MLKRRLGKMIATGMLALVGVVLALEILFRLAGLWFAALPARAPDGSIVVLCVGDSHTRGRLDPDNYPAELERLLNARTGRRYRVINLGIPGQNTAQVRTRLPRYLAYYRPAVVLHWAGINNFWNHAETEGSRALLWRALEASRVVRMVRVARYYRGLEEHTLEAPAPEPIGQPGPDFRIRTEFAGREEEIRSEPGEVLGSPEVERRTTEDLDAMMRLTRENGVPMYLITYSWWTDQWGAVNDAVRSVSKQFGVPYVDGARAVEAAAREAPDTRYFDAWIHPMPIVYRKVAEEAYQLLSEQGLVSSAGAASGKGE